MKRPDPQLQVIARSPFHIYYEGPATAVSATNAVGNFDILPGHADFFSMLNGGGIIIEKQAADSDAPEPITFNINNGIVIVREDEVMLLVNM